MTFNWSAFFAAVWPWAKARLQEKSTWVGIIGAGAILIGKQWAPETVAHYADLMTLALGAVLVGTQSK